MIRVFLLMLSLTTISAHAQTIADIDFTGYEFDLVIVNENENGTTFGQEIEHHYIITSHDAQGHLLGTGGPIGDNRPWNLNGQLTESQLMIEVRRGNGNYTADVIAELTLSMNQVDGTLSGTWTDYRTGANQGYGSVMGTFGPANNAPLGSGFVALFASLLGAGLLRRKMS